MLSSCCEKHCVMMIGNIISQFWIIATFLYVESFSYSVSDISWTPIYVDTSNQLDLWTISSTGCNCPDGGKIKNCACCVQPGGCLCTRNVNKCAQCGLEEGCQRFCNVTISSHNIAMRSGLSWVHLKSPSLNGPTSCWWQLQSAPGQRIEIQIHRLVAVGKFLTETQTCLGGFLQFSDGNVIQPNSQAIQLCAQNSRFSPPVVLFGDKSSATLLLRIDEKSSRSQLLAYVSFSSADDISVGNPSRGGRMRPHSVCDWTYNKCYRNDCVMTSPGFPGLYAPHRRCRYFINTNSSDDKIIVNFTVVNLPSPQLCGTHHISIWKTNKSSLLQLESPWNTICQKPLESIEIKGGSAIIEFRSGSSTSPYLYSGFEANIKFTKQSKNKNKQSHKDKKKKLTKTSQPTKNNNLSNEFEFIKTITTTRTPSGSFNNKSNNNNFDIFKSNRNSVTSIQTNNHDFSYRKTNLYPNNSESGESLPSPMISQEIITDSNSHKSKSSNFYNNNNNRQFENQFDEDFDQEVFSSPINLGERVGELYPISCGHTFDGELITEKAFRIRLPKVSISSSRKRYGSNNFFGDSYNCDVELQGKIYDVVQLAIFNYDLRGPNCSSRIKVYDKVDTIGSEKNNYEMESEYKLIEEVCGPKPTQISNYVSKTNKLKFSVQLPLNIYAKKPEFFDAAFKFHDEKTEGTMKPMSTCETVYYGVTSSEPEGSINGPDLSNLYKLSQFPLVCSKTFIPSYNQTSSLTIQNGGNTIYNSQYICQSICTDSGCQCTIQINHNNQFLQLHNIDHIIILAGSSPIACFCGFFSDLLPLTFESQTPLTIVHHSTNPEKVFSYTAFFKFLNKTSICHEFIVEPPTGSMRWRNVFKKEFIHSRYRNINDYLHIICQWKIVVPTNYELTIYFMSEEIQDDCNTWNLTLRMDEKYVSKEKKSYKGKPNIEEGLMLKTFCPNEGRVEYKVSPGLENVKLMLVGVTLKPPQFEVRWKYNNIEIGSGRFLTEKKKKNYKKNTSNCNKYTSNGLTTVNFLFLYFFMVFPCF